MVFQNSKPLLILSVARGSQNMVMCLKLCPPAYIELLETCPMNYKRYFARSLHVPRIE